jgi:hypothetical protein
MRELLAFACRAFPRDHRARRSDEVVDTALLAADGSTWRGAREALSLVVAGMRERLRAGPDSSIRDGVALLAGVLALVNLAVALAGIALYVHPPPPIVVLEGPAGFFARNPYVVGWWWIAFALAAAGIVLGLVLGNRRLALSAALANLGIVGYDALFLVPDFRGHLEAIVYLQGSAGYPSGWEWLAPAVVLALATAAAPLRRLPLRLLPLTLFAAVLLVALSRERYGFFFLRWPFAAILVLAMAFGWLAPRLAVLAVGLTLAVVPIVVAYLTTPYYHAPVVTWIAAPGLALGLVLPLAYLTRRRLT